jgi:hypothetical protein
MVLHAYITLGWTIGPLVAAVHRRNLTPSTWSLSSKQSKRVNLSRYHHVRDTREEEVWFLFILDLGTRWSEWSASHPGRALPLGKTSPRYPLDRTFDIQLTRKNIPEDSELHTRQHENLKSHIVNLYGELLYTNLPDDGGSKHFWNVGRHSIKNTEIHPRIFWASYSPPWEL